jgi:prepilin-type N-terminal cleavage/methylation domain-containing protein
MKLTQKGFTIVELAVAMAIIAIIGLAATMVIFQILEGTGRSNDNMEAIYQVRNAGYWITRDAQMAEGVATSGLEFPNFLSLTWTEHDYDGGDPVYHSVTYYFADLTDGIGKLKRNHWSSAGANQYTLVSEYIYYDLTDPTNTTKASYENPVLTVKLASHFGGASQAEEYKIARRPNL